MRNNQELRELYEDLDIVADIKTKISEREMQLSRRGRPGLRWLEDLDENIQEMKFKRWRQKAVDREKQASAIKKARAVRGQERQGIRKTFQKYNPPTRSFQQTIKIPTE